MLTFLPLDRIESIQADMQQQTYQPNTAQRLLAEEVIRFVHGEEGLSAALSATQVQCLCVRTHPCPGMTTVHVFRMCSQY